MNITLFRLKIKAKFSLVWQEKRDALNFVSAAPPYCPLPPAHVCRMSAPQAQTLPEEKVENIRGPDQALE